MDGRPGGFWTSLSSRTQIEGSPRSYADSPVAPLSMGSFSAAQNGVGSKSNFQVEMRALTDVPPIAQDLSAASSPPALPKSFGKITALNELLVYQIWLPESPDSRGQFTALKRLVFPPVTRPASPQSLSLRTGPVPSASGAALAGHAKRGPHARRLHPQRGHQHLRQGPGATEPRSSYRLCKARASC